MINVNLIPADRLAGKKVRKRLRLWSVVAAGYVLVLAAVSVACYTAWGGNDHAAMAKELAETKQQIDATALAIEDMTAQLLDVESALKTVETVGHQPDWSTLLALLSHELGQDVVLQACQVAPADGLSGEQGQPDVAQAPVVIDRPLGQMTYKLALVGFGRTQQAISQFVLALEGVAIFKEVRLVKSNRQPFLEGQAVAFRIECVM